MPYKNKEDALDYARKYRAENAEVCAERIKDWEKRNPDKVKSKEARHRIKYRDIRAAQSKAWREANPEKVEVYKVLDKAPKAERMAKWAKENPILVRAYAHKRRAKKTEAGGSYTIEEWFTLCFACGFRCLCCGEVKKLEPDHVLPVSRGGSSWLHNIQPLCRGCNAKKHDKHIDFRSNFDLNAIEAGLVRKDF